MRFLIRWLVLSLLLTSAAVSLLAQRGGARGGYAAGPAARASTAYGGHAYAAPRAYRPSGGGYAGIRAGGFRSGSFRSGGRYGANYRRYPYGYLFAPYYYPFLDYGSTPYYDSGYDAPQDPGAQGAYMDDAADNALGEQVQRLTAEVDQMRYGQQSRAPMYAQQSSQESQAPPVMLVLRNGQQIQVQNYAVMDQNFWDFTRQPARKIPLSSIDIAASAKATQAKGGEFPQIDAGQ
ncbi:MAG: hypothetical protein WB992_00455 [Bryobacteraceae bacterium]